MTDTLLATVQADDATRLRWRDAQGGWRAGTYAEFAALLAGRECMLLLDATQVSLLAVDLPVSDLRTARQAAPFAAEEQLAQSLDELHFAIAAEGGGHYALAALDRSLREKIAEALQASGLKPRLVVAEQCALPTVAQGWTLAVEAETVLLRIERGIAFKTTLRELAHLVPLLRQQFPDTEKVVVYADGQPAEFPRAALHGLELQWQPALSDEQRLAQLARESALALLDASADTALKAKSRRLWLMAAAVAGVALVALPAMLAWRHGTLENAERSLSARNDALFHATFPDIQRIVNPRVQADQAVAALRAGISTTPRLLDLLARLDDVRGKAFPPDTRVTQAAFASGALELGVEVAGMDAVETLRNALNDAGLSADTLSAEAADGKVVARLRVQVGS
jgi:general secretion pathway protein L